MQPFVALIFGFALGFSLTVPPGPMNALIASQSAMRGTRAGIITGTGAMTADIILAVTVFLARSLIDLHSIIRAIYLVGAAVLLVLVYLTLRSRKSGPAEEMRLTAYFRAVLLGVSNPFQILWWLTAGLAFAYLGGIVLLAGLFAAVAVWIVMFPALLHWGTGKHTGAARAVSMVSAAIMLFFAAYFIYLSM